MKASIFRIFKLAIILIVTTISFQLLPKPAYATGPSMTFVPNVMNTSVGETFTSDIVIDTQGAAIGGAGAKIVFDPDVLSIVSIDTGNIFADYPIASFDNNSGKASLSGIVASASSLYSGKDVLGSITFRATTEGNTAISFDFTPGSTVDSNLAVTYEPGDILNEVGELTVSVSGTSTTSTQAPIPSGSEDVSVIDKLLQANVSFIDKLLQAVGIKAQYESVLDPYGPIVRQDPKTDPNQRQRYSSSKSFQEGKYYIFLLSFFSLVAVLSIISAAVLIYRRKKKGNSQKPPTVHQEM